MKADKKTLELWEPYTGNGTVAEIVKKTKVSRSTVIKCLSGENVRTSNFVKVSQYFTGMKRKITRINKNLQETD